MLGIHAVKFLPGRLVNRPRLGKPEREASQGKGCEIPGSHPGGGTVPTAVEVLGKRRKSREGRKGLAESFHGGLRVRALVRIKTSGACPPPCPGPQGHELACAGLSEAPTSI